MLKLLLLTLTAAALAQPSAPFKDPRDGKSYRTVKIGEQVWMAENLNYAEKGSLCYENKAEYCKMYGRLYDWDVVMKVCPKGWHLPKNEEWDVLYKYVDSSYIAKDGYSKLAGKHLKAKTGWKEGSCGDDTYGFSALPGGYGNSNGSFYNVGDHSYWWSASVKGAIDAFPWYKYYYSENAYWYDKKANLRSVRCVRNFLY